MDRLRQPVAVQLLQVVEPRVEQPVERILVQFAHVRSDPLQFELVAGLLDLRQKLVLPAVSSASGCAARTPLDRVRPDFDLIERLASAEIAFVPASFGSPRPCPRRRPTSTVTASMASSNLAASQPGATNGSALEFDPAVPLAHVGGTRNRDAALLLDLVHLLERQGDREHVDRHRVALVVGCEVLEVDGRRNRHPAGTVGVGDVEDDERRPALLRLVVEAQRNAVPRGALAIT